MQNGDTPSSSSPIFDPAPGSNKLPPTLLELQRKYDGKNRELSTHSMITEEKGGAIVVTHFLIEEKNWSKNFLDTLFGTGAESRPLILFTQIFERTTMPRKAINNLQMR
ncbi:hypothetical protein GM658_25140 [Pseudoduganella eburnea]|uniref:Uncharacterized protein n=1 Tax=Massilia eburnea TaxID=1776165 RepID=A0A6L6QP80_9BURK|nr:hypothetical protein [Massilia eburnea]MTW13904.1 hypothetical protein [Massilia eburnea]